MRIVALLPWVAACGAAATAPPNAVEPALLTSAVAPAGYPAGPVIATAPADNPLTEARAELGKRLFFETRLSRTGEISCSSCHVQEHAFSDPHPVSTGVDGRTGTRNAPALVNAAWGASFFWDGRAKSLEEQAGMPIENPAEMDLALNVAVARLSVDASYQQSFAEAFGEPPSQATLQKAIASFVRTLVSGHSPYDRFLAGDLAALDEDARRGEDLFFSETTGCFHCHVPGALTNDGYFNDGSYLEGGDTGREHLTGHAGDLGKFKVPTLRNIAQSAPYMHDGSLASLEEVVDQYDKGGRGHPSTDPQVEPLLLSTSQKADLVGFLRSLSDPEFLQDVRFRP